MEEKIEIKEKFLPIGTVVLLKNAKKRLMITGYCLTSLDNNKYYDYSACLYPEGAISSNNTFLFNHEQIDTVYAEGFTDDEFNNYMKLLKDTIEKQKNENN